MSSRLRPFVVINKTNTSAPLNHSAAVQLADTDKGFLPNRLNTDQRDAIDNPAEGLTIYNTDSQTYEIFTSAWQQITADSLQASANLSDVPDKAVARTNLGVSGVLSGLTTGTLPIATSATSLGNSSISEDGNNVVIAISGFPFTTLFGNGSSFTLAAATGFLNLFGTYVDATSQPLIIQSHTPASANDTGRQGTIVWDNNFIYICIAENSWKRVAIAAWP